MSSPCRNCKRFPDGVGCNCYTDKCKKWVKWFVGAWDETCSMIRDLANKQLENNN